MPFARLGATEAWRAAAQSSVNAWIGRLETSPPDRLSIAHRPKFRFDKSDKFFCIGSCFARNIEEHLLYRGVEVLSKSLRCPKNEWMYRPSGLLNKFTTHSMAQELSWTLRPPDDWRGFLNEDDKGWSDLQLVPGCKPVSLERAIERRRYITQTYFRRLASADVVVLTLGLNEVWRDDSAGVFLNAAPSYFSCARNRDRYSVHVTDAAENTAELEALYAAVRTINARCRFVVTVSPVPMGQTFSGDDVIVANTRSKCVLRASAESFVRGHADADYFPSYEIVTQWPGTAYVADRLHVRDDVVGEVVRQFLELYIGDLPKLDDAFLEYPYLEANPDVDAAVREEKFPSGLAHWLAVGKSENRPLRPQEYNDAMKIMGF